MGFTVELRRPTNEEIISFKEKYSDYSESNLVTFIVADKNGTKYKWTIPRTSNINQIILAHNYLNDLL